MSLFADPRPLFQKALAERYAMGAFNISNMEMIQAIVEGAESLGSPVFLQVSFGAKKYAGLDYLVALAEVAQKNTSVPVVLHLDHGANFDVCKQCIDAGFSSVMIDGSALSYPENVALTQEVVAYAHKYNVAVEAELGQLKGVEDDVSSEESYFTDPHQALDFVQKTGCDSLAISIGTSHGAYKFSGESSLDFTRLKEIKDLIDYWNKVPFPLVLHGSSSVPKEWVSLAEKYGAQLGNARGVSEDLLSKASKLGIAKINIDTDLRLAFTGTLRQFLRENPPIFDPRKYLGESKKNMKIMVEHKIKLFGSQNKG
ncbi:MAG: class II fructose-1,6-bisphosphate aldolase [Alphaproteobacteria bacterium]|nr:class II fructose-1,6-bisphosphate aldolase [Alphaproteobacteria bacterium]